FTVYDAWNKRISTAELNRWFASALERHQPPAVSGRRIKLRYITQANARPPAFIIFSSRPEALPESYLRYLVNDLKKSFGLGPSPIRMHLRKTKNPYASEDGGKR
ncbi:MAG: ribosome biogenesis GTPase Der, partial [Rhodomicrobium sp.]